MMDLTAAITQTVAEIAPVFGINPTLTGIEEAPDLTSTDDVNAIIGFSHALRGTMLLSMGKDTALQLISKMTGGFGIEVFDQVVKSGLGEILNMIAGLAFNKINDESQYCNCSSPTVVSGNNVFIHVTRVRSTHLNFICEDGVFTISYCLE
jgi:chemotaxis protein CheX